MCPTGTSKNLNSQHFADYFKAINNPESRFFQVDEDILYYNDRYKTGE